MKVNLRIEDDTNDWWFDPKKKKTNKFGIKIACRFQNIFCVAVSGLTLENRKLTTMPAMMTDTVDKTDINRRLQTFGRSNFEPGKEKHTWRRRSCQTMQLSFFYLKKYMHGVDVNDQYRSYHSVRTLSKKWWKYLFSLVFHEYFNCEWFCFAKLTDR